MQATEMRQPVIVDAAPSFLLGLWQSFRWAIAVGNRCEAWSASGRRLDDDAIRRIITDMEREWGRP